MGATAHAVLREVGLALASLRNAAEYVWTALLFRAKNVTMETGLTTMVVEATAPLKPTGRVLVSLASASRMPCQEVQPARKVLQVFLKKSSVLPPCSSKL